MKHSPCFHECPPSVCLSPTHCKGGPIFHPWNFLKMQMSVCEVWLIFGTWIKHPDASISCPIPVLVLEIARGEVIFQEKPKNRGGVRGITPEKMLTFYNANDAFSCIINSLTVQFCTNKFVIEFCTNKFVIDCLTPASQAEEISGILVANFLKHVLLNSWSIIKMTTQWMHVEEYTGTLSECKAI